MIERIWVRGDTHGDYDFLPDFCKENNTNAATDALIILGDNALRFEGNNKAREHARKTAVSKHPITIFALRGNHDRPYNGQDGFDLTLTHCPLLDEKNPRMWHDSNYPNIWYFQDGSQYNICGKSFLTIGGAYSVDKEYRQMMHWTWYENEELSEKELEQIYNAMINKTFDYVLTHTCPISREPYWLFMKSIDQSKVSKRMEKWLELIWNHITVNELWLFGHFHDNHVYNDGTFIMLYEKIVRLI